MLFLLSIAAKFSEPSQEYYPAALVYFRFLAKLGRWPNRDIMKNILLAGG